MNICKATDSRFRMTMRYCSANMKLTNILLLYYAQQSKEKQVDFSASVSLPEQFGVPTTCYRYC
ncbi:MAG: hypothetical protein ACLR23_18500 [Clostridia bacterium]